MKLKSTAPALLVLLSVTGCMSVPASTEAPAPVTPVPSLTVSAGPGTVSVPSEPPAVHDVLGRTEERPHGTSPEGTAKHGPSDPRGSAIVPPSRTDAADRPRQYVPIPPEPRGPVAAPGSRPHPTYDMRSVCAAGQGITSGEITDLCRSTYGR